MNEARPRERVLALAKAQGVVRTRDITAAGIARTYLQRLCQEGCLVRVTRRILPPPPVPALDVQPLPPIPRLTPRHNPLR